MEEDDNNDMINNSFDSSEIDEILGYERGNVAVHRDDLVMV